jgi:hypothetical protein
VGTSAEGVKWYLSLIFVWIFSLDLVGAVPMIEEEEEEEEESEGVRDGRSVSALNEFENFCKLLLRASCCTLLLVRLLSSMWSSSRSPLDTVREPFNGLAP